MAGPSSGTAPIYSRGKLGHEGIVAKRPVFLPVRLRESCAVPLCSRLRVAELWRRLREPQRKLSGGPGVVLDKLRERPSQITAIDVGSALDLSCELIRNVPRPSFARVERDYPDRIVVLGGVEVLQRGLSITLRGICLSVDPAQLGAEVVFDDVNRIVSGGDDRGVNTDATPNGF